MITDYQAKYFAHELTKHRANDNPATQVRREFMQHCVKQNAPSPAEARDVAT